MAGKKKLMVDIDVVKRLMEEKRLEINQMAERMKVSPQTVRRFFNTDNRMNYSVEILFKIARALEVSIPTIIHEDCKKLTNEE